MKNLLQDYRNYLKIERAMSQNTVASYCSDVSRFLDAAPEDILTTSPQDIEEYVAQGHGLSKRTQARILSSLRSFFGWLVIEGMIRDNPCDCVDQPKLGRYLPEVLSLEEVERMLDSVDMSTWQGLRDKAILEVLYGCGLRVSEAVNLRLHHLFFDEGFIRVTGKGNKERLVPIGEMAMDAVMAYLDRRPDSYDAATGAFVFLNRFGKQMIESLLAEGKWDVIFRPHPQTAVSFPEVLEDIRSTFGNREHFSLDTAPNGAESMDRADMMISELSGIVFDYAFTQGKPTLIFNGSPDLRGFEAEDFDCEMWEVAVRNQIGVEFGVEDIPEICSLVEKTLQRSAGDLAAFRDANIYNFGKAGPVAAEQICEILKKVEA